MLGTTFKKVGIGKWLFVTWNVDSDDPRVVRGIVTKDTVDVHRLSVKNTFGSDLYSEWKPPMSVFQIDPASYSNELPGIWNKEKHPVTGSVKSIHEIIIDLNDVQGWTREQIADWLETLDNPPVFKTGEDIGS